DRRRIARRARLQAHRGGLRQALPASREGPRGGTLTMGSLFDPDAIGPGAGPWLGLAADLVVKTTLVLAAAALLCLACRRGSASLRHLIWAVALTGAVAMPFLTLALPAWRVPVLRAARSAGEVAPATPPPGLAM